MQDTFVSKRHQTSIQCCIIAGPASIQHWVTFSWDDISLRLQRRLGGMPIHCVFLAGGPLCTKYVTISLLLMGFFQIE